MSITLTDARHFGRFLRKQREAVGLTQDELARAVAISKRQLSRLETGQVGAPHEHTLAGLARELGLSYPALLETARGGPAEAVKEPSAQGDLPPAPPGRPPSMPRGWLGALALFLAILVGVGWPIVQGFTREEPTRVTVEGRELVWIGIDTGRVKARLSFDSHIAKAMECDWAGGEYLVVGLFSTGLDGGCVHVVDLTRRRIVRTDQPSMARVVDYFQNPRLGRGMLGVFDMQFCQFDGEGEEELVVVRRHDPFYPSTVTVLDRELRALGTYYHPGHLNTLLVADLSGDGADELYLGGTHNGCAGASVFVLDAEHCSGVAQDADAGFRADLADSALARLVFPGFEKRYLDLLHTPRLEIFDIRASGEAKGAGELMIRINKTGDVALIAHTDRHLRLVDLIPTDAFRLSADEWWRRGAADRDISAKPYLDKWLAGHRHYREGRRLHPHDSASAE